MRLNLGNLNPIVGFMGLFFLVVLKFFFSPDSFLAVQASARRHAIHKVSRIHQSDADGIADFFGAMEE